MDYLTSIIEDADHRLLDLPAPDFTVATVRRAFIVWLYCGQKNRFRDVCNYYHQLEKLEEKMTPQQRAASRHHEFTLFTQQPPTSPYLKKNYPHLYTQTHIDNQYLRKIEAIKNQCVYETLTNNTKGGTAVGNSGVPRVTSGATQQEIVDASQTIKNYCLKHRVTVNDFLESFKEYAENCGVKCTIGNIEAYIKKKAAETELDLAVEYSEKLKETTAESKENVAKTKGDDNKTVDDACRIIAESTVKNLIEFNDNEGKNKTAKKKTNSLKNGKTTKTDLKMKDEDNENKENVIEVQKTTGSNEDTFSKDDLEDSFKSIEDCDDSCVVKNAGIKEVDTNVIGEAKPVTLLKRERKQEANMNVLKSGLQDSSFVTIQTLR